MAVLPHRLCGRKLALWAAAFCLTLLYSLCHESISLNETVSYRSYTLTKVEEGGPTSVRPAQVRTTSHTYCRAGPAHMMVLTYTRCQRATLAAHVLRKPDLDLKPSLRRSRRWWPPVRCTWSCRASTTAAATCRTRSCTPCPCRCDPIPLARRVSLLSIHLHEASTPT